ncbi:MAG: TIGR00730 family Rossman fold protein [Ignavibacteria bacterium]
MENKIKRAVKAYKDVDFLNSVDARVIRIISEFLEPQRRFRHEKVRDTIVFFGSAKIISRDEAFKKLEHLKKTKAVGAKMEEAVQDMEMSKYYEDTVELAYRITKWSSKQKPLRRFVICTGGGPGLMEAANYGASKANGKSIGLNISLPYEQLPNKYITDSLNFEFHYFFMRKFWFAYLAKALVIMPGGFGTFDELFEILTLVQTHKIKKKMPIVIFDKAFWNNIVDFEELAKKKLIDTNELALFKMVSTIDEAFDYLKGELTKNYLDIKTSLFNNKRK